MFFSKSIKEVTYQDVLDFCSQKIKENFVLDYKVDFPSKLEKVLAGLANTSGGLVIIGVGDKDGQPEDNPVGIPFARGLEERVTSIVVSNVQPPFFPEVHVCPEVNGKTFVLIQVPQSANTPHAIENNTLVYIRTGNISTPERVANLDEVHWLSKQRTQSLNLRMDVLNFVNDRYSALCKSHSANISYGELNMYIVPQYPQYLTFDMRNLKDEMVSLSVNTPGGSIFPSFTRGQIQTMQDGLYLFINNKGNLGEFTEFTLFNKIGLLSHNEDLGHTMTGRDDISRNYIYMTSVVEGYFNLLRFYNKLRNKIGIWGDFKVHISLIKMEGVNVVPFNCHGYDAVPFVGRHYNYERILSLTTFKDDKSIVEELFDFADDLHWSFNYPTDTSTIRKTIEEKYKSYLV